MFEEAHANPGNASGSATEHGTGGNATEHAALASDIKDSRGSATEQPIVSAECSHSAHNMDVDNMAGHATEQPAASTECSHIAYDADTEAARHATEQPCAITEYERSIENQAPVHRPQSRYLVSVYTLNPARRPDAHTVCCIMLFKGCLSNDDLRAYIEEHIATSNAPQLHTLCGEEAMYTMNFATLASSVPLPALCQQLRAYCNRPTATRFQRPLLDGAGDTVGFLSLEAAQWQHTHDVAMRLGEQCKADLARLFR